MSMELEELKAAWHELDRRLIDQQALQWQILHEQRMDRLRGSLRPMRWSQALQLVLGIALQVFGTLAAIFAGRLLVMMSRIDYASPVLDIQRRLAELRRWRVRVEAPVFAVLGSVIWIPVMLILIQYGFDRVGHEYWDQAHGLMPWMALIGGASVLIVALVYVVLRRLGKRRWMEDQFAGSAVRRAERMLEDIARFERE
jgi:H+/gluconate symporter-like permease